MLKRLISRVAVRATKPSSLRSTGWGQQLSRSFRSTSWRMGGGIISTHRYDPSNVDDQSFEFEDMKKVETILARFPPNYKAAATMPLLQLAQKQNDNFLSLAAMNKIAEMLDVAPIRVYETASFYSMYNREKVGKYHIQLCATTPCMIRGAYDLMEAVEEHLGIKCGQTTPDGMFTLTEVECLGACVNAPMIQVNNEEFYENLEPDTIIAILEDFKAGRQPKVGPQNGLQVGCEGPQGKTSLHTKGISEKHPQWRDLDALLKQKAAEDKQKK